VVSRYTKFILINAMSSHHKGLWNEQETIKIMQRLGLLSPEVQRLGGTQNKADWMDGNVPYTAKHQDSIATGGFQWLNSSRVEKLFGDYYLDEVKQLREAYDERDVSFDGARNELAELNCHVLDHCGSEEIQNYLEEVFVKVHENFQCVITESPQRRLFMFPMEQHPVISLMRKGYAPKFQGTAESSRAIIFEKGSDVINCGLRIHLSFNNGTKRFFGVGCKPSGCSVIKMRQISLPKMLELSDAVTYSY
jgi:hypothetical protein